MSIEAMNHVWKNTNYPAGQSFVLLAIADIVNDVHDNELYMSVPNLARKCKCSDRTIQRALDQFEKDGWLNKVVKNAGRNPERFIFNFIIPEVTICQTEIPEVTICQTEIPEVTNLTARGDKLGNLEVTNPVSIPISYTKLNQVKPIPKTNVLHDLTKLYFDNFQGEAKPSGGQIAGQIKLLLKQITPERLEELIPLVALDGMPLTANTINFRANTKQSTQSKNVAMLRQMLQEESFKRIAL